MSLGIGGVPYPPGSGDGTVTSVSGTAPISVATGTTTPVVSLDALGVTTAKIAAGAVTPAKLAPALGWGGFVLGRNGAGAATLTGAKVGDKLFVATNLAAGPGQGLDRTSYFEATITVADQIQQTSAADTSAEAIQFVLIRSGS